MARGATTVERALLRGVGLAAWSWIVLAGLLAGVWSRRTRAMAAWSPADPVGVLEAFRRAVTGDFGTSVWSDRAALSIAVDHVGASVGTVAVLVVVIAALSRFVVWVRARGQWWRRCVELFGYVAAVPIAVILVVAHWLAGAGFPVPSPFSLTSTVVDLTYGATLLGLPLVAFVARVAVRPTRDRLTLVPEGWLLVAWLFSVLPAIETRWGVRGLGALFQRAIQSRNVTLFVATAALLSVPMLAAAGLREVVRAEGGSHLVDRLFPVDEIGDAIDGGGFGEDRDGDRRSGARNGDAGSADGITGREEPEPDGGRTASGASATSAGTSPAHRAPAAVLRENRRVQVGAGTLGLLLPVALLGRLGSRASTPALPRQHDAATRALLGLGAVVPDVIVTGLVGAAVGAAAGLLAARSAYGRLAGGLVLDPSINVPIAVSLWLLLLGAVPAGPVPYRVLLGLPVAAPVAWATATELRHAAGPPARAVLPALGLAPIGTAVVTILDGLAFGVGARPVRVGWAVLQVTPIRAEIGTMDVAATLAVLLVGRALPVLALFLLGEGLRREGAG
ncbi:MAG: hypothetical protein ABEJ08_00715 [Halobacteriaceae archaeon]